MVRSKRRGVFYVSGLFFHELREDEGVNLFHRMVVLRAESGFNMDATRYLAIHPDFEEVREGEIVPTYEPVFEAGSPHPKWRRKSC